MDQVGIPSQGAILERALSLSREACYAVKLQCRRLRTEAPEDEVCLSRWWVDLHFLILVLYRLKRSASIAAKVYKIKKQVNQSIRDFDAALPNLKQMRDVIEHCEQYAFDKGGHKNISRGQLQKGSWDGTTYQWLDYTLNIDDALAAANQLFMALKDCESTFIDQK
jgi:hypothetical protein